MDRAPELMSDQELVHALDQADSDLARIETRRLRLVAALDRSGYAEQVGARDTVQYLEYRYRLDHYRARRDVHLARALPKYPAITTALPDITDLPEDEEAAPAVVLRPAQAEAIVTALEKVPTTVPVADIEVAERELVRLARHLPPAELRKAAEQARDILDTDGPEPEEQKASARETLTLMTADRGVKFKGYLANENAELFRSLILAGAGPHKTLDGQPDPRTREKRQADALTTTLTLAATALDTGTPSPTIPRPTTANPHTPGTTTPGTTTPDPSSTPNPSTSGATTPDTAARATTPAAGAVAPTRDGAMNGSDGGPDQAAPGSSASGATGGSAAGSAGGLSDKSAGGSDGAAPGGAVGGAGIGPVAGRGGSGVSGDVVPGFGAKANITVTIDLHDLKAATADAIGDTVYGPGLSAATIRRLACDAKVIPIVLGSNSEPLDVGRTERLVTRAIRRALNTRDRGCVICGAPPIICDAHHLTSWIDGGPTAISNLALLCRRHHTDLHNGHWTITITNGQVHVTRPTWADPPPHPNPHQNNPCQSTAPPPRPTPHTNPRQSTAPPPRPTPHTNPRQSTAPPPPRPRSTPDRPPLDSRPPGRSTPDDPTPDDPTSDDGTSDGPTSGGPGPDHRGPDRQASDRQTVGDSAVGDPAVGRSPAGEVVAGDLRAGGDEGSVRADGSVRSVAVDSVAPGEAGLMLAASDGRLRDEAPPAPTQDGAALRDATYLAIWGERPPDDRRAKPPHRLSDSVPFDPWGESSDLTRATTAPEPS
ncbi:DUF222 domain-containing protein [Kribbella kalugense]|uniref:HNH endonuclease n=1 Tax=Kribbella kalugense TaxID=2512221 RepID=A0A4R7ZBL9_9ACTN|nr:DUF222 domain-containing protein [Kribbella kalugense]TDW14927.1 HNH endonuclease [Kribbella kalugense]